MIKSSLWPFSLTRTLTNKLNKFFQWSLEIGLDGKLKVKKAIFILFANSLDVIILL